MNREKDWQLEMSCGSWFHNLGLITFQFLAPVSVVVLGWNKLFWCLVLTRLTLLSLMVGNGKSHSGRMLFLLLNTRRHVLYMNFDCIFSHFNFWNIGETWSCFLAPPIAILAAKFNNFWTRFIWVLLVDPHTGKQ